MVLKAVTFSDTHNLHEGIKLPKCDIAFFNGDFSGRGNKFETLYFMRWYSRQTQCKYKVMVPGNHDICFDPRFNDETHAQNWWLDHFKKTYNNIIILEDSMVEIEGVKIWGSPATLWRDGDRWAHNYREEDIHEVWEKIPKGMDVIITHGPVFDVLDSTLTGKKVGCKILSKVISDLNPQYHLCGHIHESYGVEKKGNTTHINSAILNLDYEVYNYPIEFEIKKRLKASFL
jgi:Icc-related predicted phosphoesterase